MKIVIAGNSAAGLSALEAFRKKDVCSSVTVVAKEGRRPYSKVLLPYFKKGKNITVLGSGFVSLQGACAALTKGLNVSAIELMNRIMPKALDDHGAEILASRMKRVGLDLRVNTLTTRVERTDKAKYVLHFKDGDSLISDFIIVGTGVRPNIDFLEGTGIKIDTGIVVNELMETTLPGVYAAGDVAQVPSFAGGPPVIHALWPTAVETGAVCVGGAEPISTLGMLRPLIREKVRLQTKPGMLKAIIAQNISQYHQTLVSYS